MLTISCKVHHFEFSPADAKKSERKTPHQSNTILLWSECLGPPAPKFMLKFQPPKLMVLGGGASGKCFGHEGGAIIKGITAVINKF